MNGRDDRSKVSKVAAIPSDHRQGRPGTYSPSRLLGDLEGFSGYHALDQNTGPHPTPLAAGHSFRNLSSVWYTTHTGCFKKSFTMAFQVLWKRLHLNVYKLSIVQHLDW
jgi:rubredoxin